MCLVDPLAVEAMFGRNWLKIIMVGSFEVSWGHPNCLYVNVVQWRVKWWSFPLQCCCL